MLEKVVEEQITNPCILTALVYQSTWITFDFRAIPTSVAELPQLLMENTFENVANYVSLLHQKIKYVLA